MILPGLGAGLREHETRSRPMIWQARCMSIVVLASMAGGCSADVPVARSANAACSLETSDTTGYAIPDDQRASAGVMFGDTLDVQLDIRRLFGPLVVLEPGQTFEPVTDHFLVFSMAGPDLDIAPIVVNNGADPALEIGAGRTHRIRIINITAEDLVGLEIHDDEEPVNWRVLAFDGADAPAVLRAEQPARLVTGPGETVDVEIQAGAGDFRLLVRSFNDFEATIRVRPSS